MKFSIALSAMYSVLPAEARQKEKSDKNTFEISSFTVNPQSADIPAVNYTDSVTPIWKASNSLLSEKYHDTK
ncbi:MAG: hypothetical protein IJ677_08280 [Alphaproteobacteria bacterium]|nr:hypothetical protein [Alphaproteobacteria bacterium]